MIPFKRFLLEAKKPRSPKRAEKLFNYILHKRRGYHEREEMQIPNMLPYAEHPFWTEDGHTRDSHTPQTRANADMHFNRNPTLEDVPVHKIVSHQSQVSKDDVIHKMHRRGQNIPARPQFLYNPDTDKYHLDDGNHRSNSALIRGEKTIKGKVFRLPSLKGA